MAGKRVSPCTGCSWPTTAMSGLCPTCKSKRTARPERACTGCGKRTTAKTGICRDCTRPAGDVTTGAGVCAAEGCSSAATHDDLCAPCDDAKTDTESPWDLGEGDWVLRGSHRVWVTEADEPEPIVRGRCPVCTKRFAPTRRQVYCGRSCKDRAMYRRQMKRLEQERAAMNPNLAALLNDLDDAAKEAVA